MQIFDSWASELQPTDFDVFSGPYIKKVIDSVRKTHPNLPIILYISGERSVPGCCGDEGKVAGKRADGCLGFCTWWRKGNTFGGGARPAGLREHVLVREREREGGSAGRKQKTSRKRGWNPRLVPNHR